MHKTGDIQKSLKPGTLVKIREASTALLETIDLLEGRIGRTEKKALTTAYLILHWIGVWGTRSRRRKT